MNTTTATFCGAPSCGKLAPAGTLCTECHIELVKLVDSLPWDLEQLENAATNQVRFTTGGGAHGKSSEYPLMFNPYAADALAVLTASVRIWQARLADHLGKPVRYPNPVQAAHWIDANLTHVQTFINAGQMLDAFAQSHTHTEHTINRPPRRQYLGDCGDTNSEHVCPGRMFAHPEEPEGRCDTCGRTVDATQLRRDLLNKLDDRRLTAAEIAHIATYMGLTVTRDQVRKRINFWHSKNRITGTAAKGEDPTFKFLEVRLMLERDEATRRTA